ncbi:MAG: CPBP family intramembrane glutamic endopeptidase [Bacillota bacterium]
MKQLVSFMTRVRIRFLWLLLAVVVPVALSLAAAIVGLVTGGEQTIGRDLPLALALAYFLVQVVTHLLTEEPGWRGFALPRLQERYGPLRASLILGLLWGCWHLPLFLIPGRPQESMPFVGMVISVVAATVLITWLQNNAESGFPAVLFHAAMNAGFAAFGTLTNGPRLFWICTAVWVVAAVAVALATGLRKRGAPPHAMERAAG